MSEFTELNWKEALTAVYTRALSDPDYRALCLSDAVAALKQVSDIDLPPDLKFQFFEDRKDIVYPFLLPPSAVGRATTAAEVSELIRWATLCTDPTTNG